MKGTILIRLSLICFALIASTPLQVAASAVAKADEVGVGVHNVAPTKCGDIGSTCEDYKACCYQHCVDGICRCALQYESCLSAVQCCNTWARCKFGRCTF